MGYSIRTDRFRYTEWRDFQTGSLQATELYDHADDPLEMTNRAQQPEHAATVTDLASALDQLVTRRESTP
jgi:iduronate 2-sulfatase